MHARNLRYFKNTLSAQLEELDRKKRQTLDELVGSSSKLSDSIDQAIRETGLALKLRIRDRALRLIRKIKAALTRIDEGTFGICDQCGEEIALKRLKARPVTTSCIDCKNRMETSERGLESGRGIPAGAFMRARNE